MNRAIAWIVMTSLSLLLFNNCGKPKHSPLIDPGLMPLDAEEEVIPESLKLVSADTFMNCDEDHVQVGGICHPGETRINYIEITMTRACYDSECSQTGNRPVQVSFGGGSDQTFKLRSATCENGRFFAVIPRPNDPNAPNIGTNAAPEYRVESQIYVSEDGTQFRAGAKGTSFPVRIQKVGACTGNL